MSYVSFAGAPPGTMPPPKGSVMTRFSTGKAPPKAPPPKPAPPKLEPQSCYSKEEHEVLVDKCRALAGLGDFTPEYLKAITKTFACAESAKPICKKAPPPKPGMRVALPPKPKAPPPKPKLSQARPSAIPVTRVMPVERDVPMYSAAAEPPMPVGPAYEEGVSKTAIIVGVVGVAAVAGVLYMVFR